MQASTSASSVDWRMLLVEANEILYFKEKNPALTAASILEAVSRHRFVRRSVEVELGLTATTH